MHDAHQFHAAQNWPIDEDVVPDGKAPNPGAGEWTIRAINPRQTCPCAAPAQRDREL